MTELDPDAYESTDYKDKDTLYSLYWEEGLSTREIGDLFDVTSGSIQYWMDKYDIDRRDLSTALSNIHAGYETSYTGYERWRDHANSEVVKVHRLLAVTEYGFDAVADKHVHHKNGLSWDNRRENIVPMTPGEHQREHNDGEKSPNAKLSREEAKEVKRLAEEGDMTHQEISNEYGVERSLVTMIKSGRRWQSLE